MKKTGLLLTVAAGFLLASCNHKEFCYDHRFTVRIVFDWRNAPDANPASMNAHHYEFTGAIGPQRFSFGGRDGGYITTTPASYSGICFNDDISRWASVRNTRDIETYEIMTADATRLASLGLNTMHLPRVRESEDERMASTPEMLWCNSLEGIEIIDRHGDQVITYYPEEAVCYYTVTVLDIEGFEYLNGRNVDATLSGMAEGFRPWKHLPAPTKVTHPFVLSSTATPNALFSDFLTFGVPTGSDHKHFVTLYTVYENGEGEYHAYDVTDQVRQAPDPRHVDIVIRGLTIPKPIGGGGDLDVDVDDWIADDDIYLEM